MTDPNAAAQRLREPLCDNSTWFAVARKEDIRAVLDERDALLKVAEKAEAWNERDPSIRALLDLREALAALRASGADAKGKA